MLKVSPANRVTTCPVRISQFRKENPCFNSGWRQEIFVFLAVRVLPSAHNQRHIQWAPELFLQV